MSEAGQLDQRITLQHFTAAPDGIGGTVEAWVDLTLRPKIWAHVTPRVGRELAEQGRTNASQFATFTIRHRDDVSELSRILWRGEAWNIRRVIRKTPRAQYLDLDAERGVAP